MQNCQEEQSIVSCIIVCVIKLLSFINDCQFFLTSFMTRLQFMKNVTYRMSELIVDMGHDMQQHKKTFFRFQLIDCFLHVL